MEELYTCPLSGSTQWKTVLKCKDHTVSGEVFEIRECVESGFTVTHPKPAPDKLFAYYKSETYVSHTDTRKGFIHQLYHLVRKITLVQKFKLVKRVSTGNKWLDYGTGTGYFAEHALQNGIEIEGFEPDDDARKLAQEKLKSNVYSSIEMLPTDLYHTITAWHVIEHVHNLEATLAKLHAALLPGGTLVLALPNHRSYDAQHYKEYWAAYDVPRHLYHFDRSSVAKMADKFGFRISEILPMKFDSYYVSLLSEKYKTGKQNLLKAFITGFRSNLKAKKTGEFSSLIYILKRL